MKKKAYTLAEALVAMGIVGLIAALMVPMVSKFKPDINKVIYLRNYDAINSALDYITASTSIYPLHNDDRSRPAYKNVVYKNYPLYNTVAIEKGGVSFSGGAEKFCQVLALSLGVDPVPNACNKPITGDRPSFTTNSGVDYIVSTTFKEPSGSQGSYKTEILIDVNGLSEGKNQTCDTNPKDPDRFKFVVYSAGQLYPADTKGQAYLTQRSTYRSVKDTDKPTYETREGGESFTLDFSVSNDDGGSTPSQPSSQPVEPIIPSDPDPEPEPDFGVGLIPEGPLLDGPRYCANCGRKYFPSTTCSCHYCDHPIICKIGSEEIMKK